MEVHMFELWSAMNRAMNDPHQAHAMLVHLPIALSMVLPLLLIVLAFMGPRRGSGYLRLAIVFLYVMGAAAAWSAEEQGEASAHHLETMSMTPAALDELEIHEELGEKVPLIFAGAAVVTALSAIPVKMVRLIVMIVAVLGSLGATAWVSVTAHHGGQLVYVHGVGVPASPNNLHVSSPAPEGLFPKMLLTPPAHVEKPQDPVNELPGEPDSAPPAPAPAAAP
jgi:uncharacterized membrane protein